MAEDDVRALRVLEFFSGIGGMHFGAHQAIELLKSRSADKRVNLSLEVVAHFDINPNANQTYKLNFPDVQTVDTSLEHLDSIYFDNLKPDVFLMSPPCQPYTRSGKQLDTQDARAKALLHLIEVIENMNNPPQYVLMENVKNFEISESCKLLTHMLQKCGYEYQEFILSPVQFGIPNERVRYFLIARRGYPFPYSIDKSKFVLACIPEHPVFLEKPWPVYCRVEDLTELKENDDLSFVPNDKPPPISKQAQETLQPLSRYLEFANDFNEEFLVSEAILKKSVGYCFDIVDKDSKRCSCFTKSYGKFVRGTGSVIQTAQFGESITVTFEDPSAMIPLRLRYFTPREIARLHGFPDELFMFPASLTNHQCYALLGNSLTTTVVAEMLCILLSE